MDAINYESLYARMRDLPREILYQIIKEAPALTSVSRPLYCLGWPQLCQRLADPAEVAEGRDKHDSSLVDTLRVEYSEYLQEVSNDVCKRVHVKHATCMTADDISSINRFENLVSLKLYHEKISDYTKLHASSIQYMSVVIKDHASLYSLLTSSTIPSNFINLTGLLLQYTSLCSSRAWDQMLNAAAFRVKKHMIHLPQLLLVLCRGKVYDKSKVKRYIRHGRPFCYNSMSSMVKYEESLTELVGIWQVIEHRYSLNKGPHWPEEFENLKLYD